MFSEFPRTFTLKKYKIFTTNLIYNKTTYVHLTILTKPKKIYTIPDGVDGDILQACM